jgi:hypothetical protein
MMQSILDNTLPEYNLGLDSKLNDITDVWDSINFIMECEKIYDFQLMAEEHCFFESKNFSFGEIHEFITFLKDGTDSPFVHKTITENISELKEIRSIYGEYIINKRDSFLNEMLGD